MNRHRQLAKLVERRDGSRREMLTPGQAQRFDLMTAAVDAGLQARALAEAQEMPAPTWWNELAPLSKNERNAVRARVRDAVKRFNLPEVRA